MGRNGMPDRKPSAWLMMIAKNYWTFATSESVEKQQTRKMMSPIQYVPKVVTAVKAKHVTPDNVKRMLRICAEVDSTVKQMKLVKLIKKMIKKYLNVKRESLN